MFLHVYAFIWKRAWFLYDHIFLSFFWTPFLQQDLQLYIQKTKRWWRLLFLLKFNSYLFDAKSNWLEYETWPWNFFSFTKTGDRSCEKLSSHIPKHRARHYILKCLRESFESVASAENLTNNQNRFISGTREHTNVPLFQLRFTVVSVSQFYIVNILDDMAWHDIFIVNWINMVYYNNVLKLYFRRVYRV